MLLSFAHDLVKLVLILLFDFFLAVDQHLEQVRQDLDTLLDLSLHEVDNTFSEISVEAEPLRVEVVVGCFLEVFVSIVNVFLLDENLENFKVSISRVELMEFWVDLFVCTVC